MPGSPATREDHPPLEWLGHPRTRIVEHARQQLGWRDERRLGVVRQLWRQALVPDGPGAIQGDPGAHLTAEERRALDDTVAGTELAVLSHIRDEGAEKLVLHNTATPEHERFECVRIPMGRGRESLCVSVQVGCRMACTFCETGRMGRLRDLRPAEVLAQLVAARQYGWRVDNLVFMGMGEALDAFDTLAQSLEVLTDQAGIGLASERITVCTVGHADGIRRLAALPYRRLGLSLSLNSALDDTLRARTMPVAAKQWLLADVHDALLHYRSTRRRNLQLGVHWCLMPGINDSAGEATAIARFCAPLGRVLVHVIPYNPGTSPLTRAPSEGEIVSFIERLRGHGLAVRRRVTKGRSAMAACGQLGDPKLRRAARTHERAATD